MKEHCHLPALGYLTALSFFVVSAQAQTAILPPIGGSGGGQFTARCAETELLAGFELRSGEDIDAIRPLCVTAYGPNEAAAPRMTTGSGVVVVYRSPLGETFNKVEVVPGWYGGPGGSIGNVVCPTGQPVVIGVYVRAEGIRVISVNNIHLFCGAAAAKQNPSDLPSAVFDAPRARPRSNGLLSDDNVLEVSDTQRCPSGLVAVGVHGRSGEWVDEIGLICGPPVVREVVKAAARVAGSSASGPARPICDVAREARARKSPAAAGLAVKCRLELEAAAVRENAPVRAAGRAKVAGETSNAPRAICDIAREARARNSPAASGLEAQCRAAGAAGEAPPFDVNDLAARGEAIANADPLALELRNQQPDEASRRGFDIGMSAAEGQTLAGPSKQRIHDALSAGEQAGFSSAVSFSLERNRNADLAAKGWAIAQSDAVVADARALDADVFYRLGFDIASALFGDPAAGGEGRTQTGPNSLKIRDSLSEAGQRGFNASVALHLSRDYKR